jgi:membrane protease YdiL (CAAX protease family)
VWYFIMIFYECYTKLGMKTIINWRIFFTLLSLSILSVFAVFPYVLTLQGEILKQVGQPILIIFLLQLFQSGILFSLAIFLGLYLKNKINFHLPLLEALVSHKDYKKVIREISLLSALLGSITALIIYVTDHLFALQGSAISTSQNLAPVWQKLLAAFYGGITEEILMRLFLMTLFIWIGTKLTRQRQPTQTVIIIAILVAAVIFGLGHLPITASLTKITPIIIARAIFLNGIGGIIFGWLYWKKGLESAMIAHFTADIFLLTLLPLLFK